MLYFLFFIMLFCHLIDDYYLQGILANLKQKQWWKENASDNLYKNDYIIALMEHAFSWTFVIMLPIMVFMIYYNCIGIVFYCCFFGLNWTIHGIVDDLKANAKIIGLTVDQCIHIAQITITWGGFILYIKNYFSILI